ncbi:MAG: hypothetical protein JXB25_03965 [Deltaproteobacteria bacterium]|nr:hypothetical protein [Deltaproteobacteria bacterium]
MAPASKKILIVCFTQTGQLRRIVDSITEPLAVDGGIEIYHEGLKPKPAFPFPWSFDSFFQVMPESVLGHPCAIEPLTLSGDEDFDLIVIAYQPWFLSPSLPVHAFFQTPAARMLLSGKPVLTISGSRNMWVSAYADIRRQIEEAGGHPVGTISLCDPAPNMVSAVTIVRWMLQGKQDRFLKFFPPAGVAEADLRGAARFGPLIREALLAGDFAPLRGQLVAAGAVEVNPELVTIEDRVKPIFRFWAGFIRAKGTAGDSARLGRIRIFQVYLLTVLYLVSPLVGLVCWALKPFRKEAIRKRIAAIQSQ